MRVCVHTFSWEEFLKDSHRGKEYLLWVERSQRTFFNLEKVMSQSLFSCITKRSWEYATKVLLVTTILTSF